MAAPSASSKATRSANGPKPASPKIPMTKGRAGNLTSPAKVGEVFSWCSACLRGRKNKPPRHEGMNQYGSSQLDQKTPLGDVVDSLLGQLFRHLHRVVGSGGIPAILFGPIALLLWAGRYGPFHLAAQSDPLGPNRREFSWPLLQAVGPHGSHVVASDSRSF